MPQKKSEKIDKSSVAYIFGILSIVFAFFSPVAGIVFGIVGITQGKQVSKKIKRLSIIGLILSVVLLIALLIVTFYSANNQFTNLFPSI